MEPRGILKTRNGKLVDEQDFRDREESGAVALALVLHDDAQNVWQRPDAGEDADACAGFGLGQRWDGSRTGREAARVGCPF